MRDKEMKANDMSRISKMAAAVAVATALSMGAGSAFAVPTATKKITCYKGTQKKVVTTAKCPQGWSTKKPATTVKAGPTAFNATFTGKLSWTATDTLATVESLEGTSSNASVGLTKLSGTGKGALGAAKVPLAGSGKISGADGSIDFTIDTAKSSASGTDSEAPTTVIVNATANITGGSGKFAGAKGTLTFKGTFPIKTIKPGKETEDFSVTVTGTITK